TISWRWVGAMSIGRPPEDHPGPAGRTTGRSISSERINDHAQDHGKRPREPSSAGTEYRTAAGSKVVDLRDTRCTRHHFWPDRDRAAGRDHDIAGAGVFGLCLRRRYF